MARLRSILYNMRLQTRISLLVSVGVVTVLVLFTLISVRVVQDTTDEIVRERQVVAEMSASYVDSILDEALFELAKATTFAPFDPMDSNLAEERHVMAHTYGRVGNFTEGIFFLDKNGVVLAAQPPEIVPVGHNLSPHYSIKQSLATGNSSISNAFLFEPTNKPTVAVTLPIKNKSGEVISVLCGLIDLQSPRFARILEHSTKLGQTGHADIVDANGRVVASSDTKDVLLPAEHPDFYRRMLQQMKPAVETTAANDPREPGTRHVMAFAPLKSAPWGVGLGASEEDTFAPVRREQNEAIVFGIIALIAALIVAFLTTRRVVRPVEALISDVKRLASGDLASPIKIPGGDEVGMLAATFDETRLKLQAAYQALTVEKSQYQGIFRSMADPVFTVDTTLRITSLNPAAEVMVGRPAVEVVGMHCRDILQPRVEGEDVACNSHCPLVPGADGQQPLSKSVEAVIGKQGNRITVEATRAPIYSDDGQLVGVVHVLRDISAQEELNRLKEQFLSNVSHELRSPLGYVKGYASTLLRRDAQWDEKTRQQFLREILRASEKLQELVDDLLDTSRLQAQAFTIESQPVQIKQIVRSAVKWVQSQPNKHKFVVSFPRDVPWVLADPQRTEQMVRNLLENAVKYSPDGGNIRITGHTEDSMVIVSVADEGIGIMGEQIDHVFERFYRASSGPASQIGGVGLGLSICKSIAEAQGGRIWVESVYGKGSIFHFSVPVFDN